MKKLIITAAFLTACLLLVSGGILQPAIAADDPAAATGDEAEKLEPMELNGTEWAVEVRFVNEKGVKETVEDTLMFKNRQFISKLYEEDDYVPTNYSLTVSEDDVTSFGTMQIKETKKTKETSFWKGKVIGDQISGSLHIQYNDEGVNETRYFNGSLTKGELKRRGEPSASDAVEATQPTLVTE